MWLRLAISAYVAAVGATVMRGPSLETESRVSRDFYWWSPDAEHTDDSPWYVF